MKEYLISIVIPVFNRAHTIRRAVESCIKQSYKNLEIIVVDDASSDNISEVMSSINDERIKFLQHDRNKGEAASRNTGLRNSNGDYITFLDSDDEWMPNKIERQLEVFNEVKQEIGLIFTNGYSEAEGREFIAGSAPSGIYYDSRRDNFYPLRKLITPSSSWMLTIKIARDIGYFDEAMRTWDDGDYLTRIAYKYPLYFLNENLVIWHWHVRESHLNVISDDLVNGKELFLNKNLDYLKRDKEYLFRFYRALGKDMLRLNKRKARHYLLNAFKLNPWDFSNLSKILKTL